VDEAKTKVIVGKWDIATAVLLPLLADVAGDDNTHGEPILHMPDVCSIAVMVAVEAAAVDNSHREVAVYWDMDRVDTTFPVEKLVDWELVVEFVVIVVVAVQGKVVVVRLPLLLLRFPQVTVNDHEYPLHHRLDTQASLVMYIQDHHPYPKDLQRQKTL
jgi:hypothetical protein